MPTGQGIEAVLTRVWLFDRNIDRIAVPPLPDRAGAERDLNLRRQTGVGRADDIERQKLRASERVRPEHTNLEHLSASDGFVATAEARDRAAFHAIIGRIGRSGGYQSSGQNDRAERRGRN